MNSYLLALFEPCEKKKQKHPSRGVQPYRKTPMPKSDFNKVAIFWYGCSPVNLLHIFRTPFPKNTSGRLLLKIYLSVTSCSCVTNIHYTSNILVKIMDLIQFFFRMLTLKTLV